MSLVTIDRVRFFDNAVAAVVRRPDIGRAVLAALGYAAITTTWIILSDAALLFFFPADADALTMAQTVKGWLFVAVTAALLFFGVRYLLLQIGAKEDALRDRQHAEERLIDTLPEAVLILDRDGRIERLNPASKRVLGPALQRSLGTFWLETVAEIDRRTAAHAINRARSGTSTDFRCLLLSEHGPVPYQLRSAPMYGSDGTVQKVLAICRDISAVERAEEQSRSRFAGLPLALIQFVEALAAVVEARDPYTHGHQGRVASLACRIGREIGMEEDRIEGLRLAALVHDLGKIAVPMEFLTKPTQLSDAEMAVVRSHSRIAYDILKRVDFAWPVATIVHQHHERIDGSGYPTGLKGNAILPEAQILGIADVIDAMDSDRLYRRAPGLQKAIDELNANRGRLYDPALVDAVLRVVASPKSDVRAA